MNTLAANEPNSEWYIEDDYENACLELLEPNFFTIELDMTFLAYRLGKPFEENPDKKSEFLDGELSVLTENREEIYTVLIEGHEFKESVNDRLLSVLETQRKNRLRQQLKKEE